MIGLQLVLFELSERQACGVTLKDLAVPVSGWSYGTILPGNGGGSKVNGPSYLTLGSLQMLRSLTNLPVRFPPFRGQQASPYLRSMQPSSFQQ